jgi:hypothetical protein
MDTPWNYIFVCLKNHKGNIIVWIVIKNFKIFFTNYKFYMFKAWHKSKIFLHIQSTQTLEMNNPYFFQTSFVSTKCASFLLKIEKNLILMNRRAKWFELMIFYFYNQFEHIWLKHAFNPKNYEFWKCDHNKSFSYLCDRGHECIILSYKINLLSKCINI